MRPIPLAAALAGIAATALAGPSFAAAGSAPEGPRLHAPTPTVSWVGRLLVPVSARVAPRMSARAIAAVQPVAPLGKGPTSLLVTGVRRAEGRTWVRVLLPLRPNGTQGWAPADAFRFTPTSLRIVIDQGDRRLTLYRRGRPLFRVPVAVGRAQTPTPTGEFAVAEMIRTRARGAFLGPIVFPLTGYSETLNEYAGGNGRVAMHGTSLPHLIGTRASHGCIRILNRDVVRLSRLVRPGTPVTIRW